MLALEAFSFALSMVISEAWVFAEMLWRYHYFRKGLSYRMPTGIDINFSVNGRLSWARQMIPPEPTGMLSFCKT